MNIDILKQNLIGTNWNNTRIENNEIVSDFYGKLFYAIGDGQTNCYEGTTKCYLLPSKKITENIFDYGLDQSAFIKQELDFKPVGEKNSF